MLYQLSYTRVPHILAPQDFAAAGVLSVPTLVGDQPQALPRTSKQSGGSLAG